MTKVSVTCPTCHASLTVPADGPAKRARCPGCRNEFTFSVSRQQAPAAADSMQGLADSTQQVARQFGKAGGQVMLFGLSLPLVGLLWLVLAAMSGCLN